MNHQFLISAGFGFLMLGVCFYIIDLIVARNVSRMRPPNSPQKFANQTRAAMLSHRMRRGAFILTVVGVLVLISAHFVS
jgi:hypothetical protein